MHNITVLQLAEKFAKANHSDWETLNEVTKQHYIKHELYSAAVAYEEIEKLRIINNKAMSIINKLRNPNNDSDFLDSLNFNTEINNFLEEYKSH